MVVIIKSGPDTADGKRGVKLARDMAADVVFIQNGVYFAQKERLEGFCGTVFVLDDDARLRGLHESDLEKDMRRLSYNDLVDVMVAEDKVIGFF